jgi:hypothetical protein
MQQYELTLVVDRDPIDLTDALFEVAQGDLIPEGGRSVVHAFFEADSLAEALVAVVHQVESVGLTVIGLESDDLVTIADIAQRTGRTYESVRLLITGKRGKGGFPAPVSADHEFYSWILVKAWFAQHYSSEEASAYDRDIASFDYLLRSRYLIPRQRTEERAEVLKSLDSKRMN